MDLIVCCFGNRLDWISRSSGERPKARCVGITFSVSLLVPRVGRVAKKSSCELLARLSRDKSRDLAGAPNYGGD